MSDDTILRVDGEVETPLQLSLNDLRNIAEEFQVADVRKQAPERPGTAITLAALIERAGCRPTAKFLGLHGSRDDFHASIPLEPVRQKGLLIYALDGQPLSVEKGGPLRFFIPDFAACHTDEIDECANVKFVDHIEFTATKGFDNRPDDDEQHAELHAKEQAGDSDQ